MPRYVEVVDALPINASGKVLKTELRERFAHRSGPRGTNERSLMRGIVYTGDDAEVTDKLEVAEPGPDRGQGEDRAAGVCHSDLSVLDGTIPWKAPRSSATRARASSRRWAPGALGQARRPRRHRHPGQLRDVPGLQHRPPHHVHQAASATSRRPSPTTASRPRTSPAASVFAEYTIVQEVQAVPISKDVPFTSACLIGCGVLTGVGSVLNRAKVARARPRRSSASGGVGLNVIQALRLPAPAASWPSTPWPPRRAWPASSGPPTSSTPRRGRRRGGDPGDRAPGPKSVAGALGPGGVTWAFDCVGHPAVLRNAIDVLDWGGTAVAIGIPPRGTEVSVDINDLAYVDRGLIGCRYGSSRPHHDIPLMVELYLRAS